MDAREAQEWLEAKLAEKKAKHDAEIAATPKRPMTHDEYMQLQTLYACTMRPASYEKHFVRQMSSLPEGSEITPKQAALIANLWFRYRRQHGFEYVELKSYGT